MKQKEKKERIKRVGRIGPIALVGFLFALLFFFAAAQSTEASVGKYINYQGKLTNTSDVAVSDGAYNMVFKIYDAAGGGSTLWTETWTDAVLWTETGSTTITDGDGGDCPTTTKKIAYTTGTNEGSLKAGQLLWNTTIKQSSVIDSVNTGSDFICVFNPASTWNNGDDLTNRIYVRNGIFSISLGTITSLTENFTGANNFLGVTVGGDSEMKPRKRMTAVPQAVNALNVVGDGYISLGNTSPSQDAVNINYNPASGSNEAVEITYGSGGGTGTALKVSQAGSGDILNLFDGTNEVMTVLENGNVGIGTTNPSQALELGPSKWLSFEGATEDAVETIFQVTDPTVSDKTITFQNNSGIVPLGTAGNTLFFTTSGNTSLTLPTSGTLMTNPMTTAGDLIYGGAGGTPTALAGSGTNDYVLKYNLAGNTPYWGAATGGSQTPWTGDIDADGYDLADLSNVELRETTGAPAGTSVAIFRDNTGDINLNALTGKNINLQINGADEYNFSSTGLSFNSNNITGLGTNLTSAAGLTIASTTNDLILDSGSNTLTIAATDTALTASGIATIDLAGTVAVDSTIYDLGGGAATTIRTLSGNAGLTLAANGTGTITIDPTGAGAIALGSADVTGISFTTNNDAADDFTFAGGATFNDEMTLTLAGTENLVVGNTTQGAADLVSIAPTWTADNTGDALQITATYNVSASTGTQYGLNLVNADNAANTGVIDALALFSNNQATETMADGVIIRHNAASGTLTDGLHIENTTAGGTIANAINILETAGTITTGINIGTVTTGITIGTGVTTGISIASGGITITGGALAINNATGITSNQATLIINASGTVDVDDILNANSITSDAGVSIAAGNSYTGAGAVTLSSAAASALTINSGTTGTIAIGDDASAETITISTGAAAKTLTIGSTNTTSTTTVQSGSGHINLQANSTSTGNVQIGDGGATSATPDMLVMDIGSADPSGTNGAMYYSTASNAFRCYENSAWKNCDTTGAGAGYMDLLAESTLASAASSIDLTVAAREFLNCYLTTKGNTATAVTWLRFNDDAGTNYDYQLNYNIATAFVEAQGLAQAQIVLDTTDTETQHTMVQISNFSDQMKNVWLRSNRADNTTGPDNQFGSGTWRNTAAQITKVSFLTSTSTFIAGSHAWCEGRNVADYAENYYSKDTSIEAGDVVTYDPSLPAGIQKSAKPYDPRLIGSISTKPGIVLDEGIGFGHGWQYPVALSGRIPVKVNIENGPIESGDLLTSSSMPGVAMKATKAGAVIGMAMESFDGEGTGKVLTFVKTTYYNGSGSRDLLANSGDIPSVDADSNSSLRLLNYLVNEKVKYADDSALSEVTTDRLVAGLEVVTPKVTAQTVALDNLQAATGKDIALHLTSDGKFLVKNEAGETGITFDGSGNAAFSGVVTADRIKANTIEGLEFIQSGFVANEEDFQNLGARLDELDAKLAGLSLAIAGSQVLENGSQALPDSDKMLYISQIKELQTQGALSVGGPSEFQGPAMFRAIAEFIEKTVFRGETEFEKTARFQKGMEVSGYMVLDRDSAGYAVIKKGTQSVTINFAKEYGAAPVVNVNLSLQQFDDPEVKAAAEDLLLVSDVKYIITNVTAKGFEIKMDRAADSDIPFSWQAVAVKDPKTFTNDSAENLIPETGPNQISETPNLELSADQPAVLLPGAVPASDPVSSESSVPVSSVPEDIPPPEKPPG